MQPSSADAYKSLSAYKPREATEVIGQAEAKYDIPGQTTRLSQLRGLVGNLSSAVEAVDPSVTGRTSGTFTTEGQRQALVSRERAPILSDLAKQQGSLGEQQAAFNTSQGLASQLASTMLTEDRSAYQRLLDTYNSSLAAEQEQERKRQFDAQLAEQRAARDAESRALQAQIAASSIDFDKIMKQIRGGVTPSSANGSMQQNGSSFSFFDKNMKPITAAAYASSNNIDVRDLLRQMANAGDKDALTAYNRLATAGTGVMVTQSLKNQFPQLMGAGTNSYTATPAASTAASSTTRNSAVSIPGLSTTGQSILNQLGIKR